MGQGIVHSSCRPPSRDLKSPALLIKRRRPHCIIRDAVATSANALALGSRLGGRDDEMYSRGAIAPELCKNQSRPKEEGAARPPRGGARDPQERARATSKKRRREDRVRAAPAVSCANCASKKRTRAYRFSGGIRPSLRNGFTAYSVLSPVTGLVDTVVPEKRQQRGVRTTRLGRTQPAFRPARTCAPDAVRVHRIPSQRS
jgi:hypothetical protein